MGSALCLHNTGRSLFRSQGSDPALRNDERRHLIHALVETRPAVKEAKASNDTDLPRAALAVVDEANVALGERGSKWWGDGSPDYNRQKAINTPYVEWYRCPSSSDDPSAIRGYGEQSTGINRLVHCIILAGDLHRYAIHYLVAPGNHCHRVRNKPIH